MIKFSDVYFSYKDKIIFDNFNITINNGDRICITGPSGKGKSTFINLLGGVISPREGKIINDFGNMSVMMQNNLLIPRKNVIANTIMFAPDNTEKAIKILDDLGLEKEHDSLPHNLSGGMARRVALARCLCRDAELYILDEPFAGLDEDSIKRACDVINSNTRDKTLIVISHNLDYAKMICNKIISI